MPETTETERAEQLHDEAFELYRQGDLDSALATVEQSLLEDLTWSTSHATHALILAARGEERAAERAAHAALKIEPNYAYAHFAKGVVLLEREQLENAAEAFQNAVRYDGQSSDALVQLGLCRWQLGEKNLARRDFELALRLDPEDGRPAQYLASLALDAEDAEAALKWVEKALEIDADNAEATALHAEVLWELERGTEALDILKAWSRVHADHVWSRDMAARCALQMDDLDTSRVWLDEALALAPDNVDLKLLDAALNASNGALEAAVVSLNETLERHPDQVDALNYLAALQQDLKRYDASAETCRKVLALDANDVNARITLARCYLADGRTDEAQTLIGEVLEDHPSDEGALDVQAAITHSRAFWTQLASRPKSLAMLIAASISACLAIFFSGPFGYSNVAAASFCVAVSTALCAWLLIDLKRR
jgi:tetratricopeptide (TPR) repeat protein